MNKWLEFNAIEKEDIIDFLNKTHLIEEKKVKYSFPNKIIATLFLEPSTRTLNSFQVAAYNLGCKVINFNEKFSSAVKGETFLDTCKTFEAIGVNALVIRSTEEKYFNKLKEIKIPILNAGDGANAHPTQCLLDIYTIWKHFNKKLNGLKILIIGDVKHSRVASSNKKVMELLGMKVDFFGPKELSSNDSGNTDLDKVIGNYDVVMLLRIQLERHESNEFNFSPSEYNEKYGLNETRIKKLKPSAIIMHPAPFNRGVELTDKVLDSEKCKIFEQMTNGVFVRMELLKRGLE